MVEMYLRVKQSVTVIEEKLMELIVLDVSLKRVPVPSFM